MYYRYNVKWDFDDKETTNTGLIHVEDETENGYAKAMDKILEAFDQIYSVKLSQFAPDDCLDVSPKALDEIGKDVIW
mgnify:CR=1 FL=1